MSPDMSMKEVAQKVLDVQNACNLHAVVLTWEEIITWLKEWHRKMKSIKSTTEINQHPFNQLLADKVTQLSGLSGDGEWNRAYKEVVALANS
jgi:hypothetical protein